MEEPAVLRLVSPTRVLHLLDAHAERGEPALQRIAKIYGLDAVDVGNLRQLLGWVGVGEKRKPRRKSGGFELFSEDTRVLKHDEHSELVLLVGTVNHIYETVVVPHPHMDFAERSLKNLLNKSKPHVNGWKKLTKQQVAQLVVPQVLLLEVGASLVGLVAALPVSAPPVAPPPVPAQSFAPANAAFTFPTGWPTAQDKSQMVPAADAAAAVHLAAQATAQVYVAQLHDVEVRHRAETEALRTENEELRAGKEQERERANEAEDELRWYQDALKDARDELSALLRDSTKARDVMALWGAQRRRSNAVSAVATMQVQLQVAMARLEATAREQARERHAGRHASDCVKQTAIEEGETLRELLTTKASARETLAGASTEPMTELTPQRINQLVQHAEAVLFGAGRGDLERTQLLLAALLDRPVVQRLLGAGAPQSLKAIDAAKQMLASAREMLAGLSTGSTKEGKARLAFETIVMALVPEDATENRLLRTIKSLLGFNHDQIKRAVDLKRLASAMYAPDSELVAAVHESRKRRKDARDKGRALCDTWWHANTRFDTNPRKKKRMRIGRKKYKEHWRHIQYDTNEAMARMFFASHEYSQYLNEGGLPFKEDIFYESKCACIEQSKFEECACPICTIARETAREYDRQRTLWHKDSGCNCGACGKGSLFRQASRSFAALRAFLHAPCGKESLDELIISKGPKSCETVEMYRRQCCRVPLPEIADALKAVEAAAAASKAAADLRRGADASELEWDDSEPATWKEWRPRIEADGKSYQAELRTITGTRKGLMERMQAIFAEADPHMWIDTWQTHMRHLIYATFTSDEMCISTDFSAQFDHKCAWTLTCEHPPRSNQAVYVVTHSPTIDDDGVRSVTTDV